MTNLCECCRPASSSHLDGKTLWDVRERCMWSRARLRTEGRSHDDTVVQPDSPHLITLRNHGNSNTTHLLVHVTTSHCPNGCIVLSGGTVTITMLQHEHHVHVLSVHLAVCTPTYTPVSTPSFLRTWLCAHLPLHPSYSCLYTCLYNELWRHLWVDFWLPWRWRWLLLFVLLLSSCQCTYQRAGCASRLCWLFPNFTRFYLWLSVFDRLTLYWQQIKCQQKLHFMLSFIGCKW